MKKSIINVFLGVFFTLFTISFSIAVPILIRPFYYAHIKWLDLVNETGYSYSMIKGGYDSVMNYLLFGGKFSLGEFTYSEAGKAHFVDCRPLFILDLVVLIISSVLFIAYFVLKRKKVIGSTYRKYSPFFISSICLIIALIVIGIWGAVDFESLFTAFHHICFPGKDNWLFDSFTDPIIEVLPEQFWLDCGILIGVILLIICLTTIIKNIKRIKKTSIS